MRDLKYDFAAIEPKWQKKWQETGVYQTGNHSDKPKFYALVEFPYPSGQGLHVGHARPYTAMDVVARKRRMDGYNEIGRARVGKECSEPCRSRWSPYH